jgi:outer membrane biosynthesis protein TonB
MKKVFTVMFVFFAVLAFACVSFAAPEGKIKTETPPAAADKTTPVKDPKVKVDKTKTTTTTDKKAEEKKDPKAANTGKKVEKKDETTKGTK